MYFCINEILSFIWEYFLPFGYITLGFITARCGFPFAETDSPICGHENKTYQNECTMRREACRRNKPSLKLIMENAKLVSEYLWIFCVKSDQIRNFFWSVFSSIWTRNTLYLDTFYEVNILSVLYCSVTDKKVLSFRGFGWFGVFKDAAVHYYSK